MCRYRARGGSAIDRDDVSNHMLRPRLPFWLHCSAGAGFTSTKHVRCLLQLANKGNVRLGNITTGLEGCSPMLLAPNQATNCTITR